VAADDVDLGLALELGAQPDALRDREVPRDVAGQLLDRLVLGLAAPFETRPIGRDRDPALAVDGFLDEHAQLRCHPEHATESVEARPQTRAASRWRCAGYSWISRIAVEPSPPAAATRFTGLTRTSPAANTPRMVVASPSPSDGSDRCSPVRMKPWSSRATSGG